MTEKIYSLLENIKNGETIKLKKEGKNEDILRTFIPSRNDENQIVCTYKKDILNKNGTVKKTKILKEKASNTFVQFELCDLAREGYKLI